METLTGIAGSLFGGGKDHLASSRSYPSPPRVPFQPKNAPCGSGIPAPVQAQPGNLGNPVAAEQYCRVSERLWGCRGVADPIAASRRRGPLEL